MRLLLLLLTLFSITAQAQVQLNIVGSLTNVGQLNANQAFTGSNYFAQITPRYSVGAVVQLNTNLAIDFHLASIQTTTCTNDLYFFPTNTLTGGSVTIDVSAGTTNRALSFDTNMVWLGTPAPTLLNSNKVAWFRFIATGTTTNSIRAFYAPQIP